VTAHGVGGMPRKRRNPGTPARATSTTPIATGDHTDRCTRCRRCRRRLFAPVSTKRGAGPICHRYLAGRPEAMAS
jgi:hypothetical protein